MDEATAYLRASLALAGLLMLGGVLVLAGWNFDITVLKSMLPGFVFMKPLTAICFVLSGLSLWMRCERPDRRVARLLALTAGSFVIVISALTLTEYLFALDFGFDNLIFPEASTASQFPGRMVPATAVGLLMLGCGLMCIDVRIGRAFYPAELSALGALVTGSLATIGFVYGVAALYRWPSFASMALHTAVLLVAGSSGLLLARPSRGVMSTITSRLNGGVVARWALPLAVVLPFGIGWLRLAGQRADLYDAELGAALHTVADSLIFTLLIWFLARSLNAFDAGRIRSTMEIAEGKKRLAGIVESAMDAIITTTQEQRIVLFNAAAEKIFRIPASQAIGQSLDRFLPERARQAHTQHIRNFGDAGTTKRSMGGEYGPLWAVRSDGEEFPIEASISKSRIDGGWLFTVILRDITERLRLEANMQQAQKMEALGTLAGGVAHDFNNILAGIAGNARIALEELPAAHPLHHNLADIDKAAARAADLVRQILTFSRQQPPERSLMKPQGVVEEAVKLLRATLPAMIEIRTACSDRTPDILADGSQIHQVIMNLGTNAAHAMGEHGGVLDIRLDPVSVTPQFAHEVADLHAGDYARLSVSDNGHGMDRQTLARIFEPFFTTKPIGKGTGLGLAAVHGIVKSHGGALTVHSELGKGTTFHVYFPAAQKQADVAPATAAEPATGNGEHIMLVDDEPVLLAIGSRALTKLGYIVTTFRDPLEALNAFRAHPERYQALLTDRSMPALSGFAFAAEVMRIDAGIPIIIMSGHISPDDAKLAGEMGIQEIMMKPFNSTQLGDAVRRAVLNNQEAIAEGRRAGKSAEVVPFPSATVR